MQFYTYLFFLKLNFIKKYILYFLKKKEIVTNKI